MAERVKINSFRMLAAGAVLILGLLAMAGPAWADTFIVDRTTDQADASPTDNRCDVSNANGDQCTLRAAIQQANTTPVADTINFNITTGAAAVKTITPTSPLPDITQPVTINGYSQTGAQTNTQAVGNDAVLLIELNGASAGASANGLRIDATESTVRGLVINRFGQSGVRIGASGNFVRGNYIGTDKNGTADLGNTLDGVRIQNSSKNVVGGTAEGARNVISGNRQSGVRIEASGNFVQGNYIGTDKNGTADLGNNFDGVRILNSSKNVVGGTAEGARNVISGNNSNGVNITISSGYVGEDGVEGNWVEGNYIGTDKNGTADLGNSVHGVRIEDGSGNNVGGTVTGARNVISGNNSEGIYIVGGGATANRVEGNYIGTDKNGTADLGNTGDGVLISNAPANTIGGATSGARNVISGNNSEGIYIVGGGATDNRVEGNYIGTDKDGTADLGNSTYGVLLVSTGPYNVIGGTASGARNVISGNNSQGVRISGAGGNFVRGNYVGTNATGTASVGDTTTVVQGDGVVLAAPNNTVGGTATGAGNLVSGNRLSGVRIEGPSSTGNVVQGNYIGTDATGTQAVLNDRGVQILAGANNNTIGGTVQGARNVISGNRIGINIGGNDNLVHGNYIGTDKNGTADLGNTNDGVLITTSGNIVGGANSAGESNVIAHNGNAGVYVEAGNINAVLGNSIYSNGALGIDLSGGTEDSFGVTANDVDPNGPNDDADNGPNNLQNFPVITAATEVGGTTTIRGTLNSTPNAPFNVQFFSSPQKDPSDHGEGKKFLGQTDAVTDQNGDATFVFATTDASASLGQFVTATATNPGNNTSEFSRAAAVTPANTAPVVTLSPANPTVVNEGTTHTYDFTVTDPDAGDSFTVASGFPDCGAGGVYVPDSLTTTSTGGRFRCSFPDGPATPTVRIQVTDSQNAESNVAAQDVRVINVAPTVELTGDETAEEGDTKTYTYTVTDPGNDPNPTIQESCGQNGTKTDTPEANNFRCTFPDGPASSTVSVTATDEDGDSGSDSKQVTISNVAPTVTLEGANTANEGQTETYTYTVADPGNDTYTTVEESCGDNGVYTNTPEENSFRCTFPDGPANSTVSVTVADSDGENDSDTKAVTVSNVAPSISLRGPQTAEEGDTKTYTYTVTDPGNDTHTTTTGCGDNGVKVTGSDVYNEATKEGSFRCTFPDGPSTTNVTASVTDSDGASDADNQVVQVQVANVDPTVELIGENSANEGQTKTYTYTVTDPGNDPNPTITESCGQNGIKTDTQEPNSFQCTFPDGPANSTVSVTAADSDGDSGSDSIDVTISNVAPTVELRGETTANEGETKTYTFMITDPGEDTHTTTTSCGDNGTKVAGSENYDPGTKEGSFRCRFPNGPATTNVTARTTDSDGASDSDNQVVVVTIANVAPTVVLTGDEAANEGQTKTYTYAVTDPGDDTNPTITESCGENGVYVDTLEPNSFDCRFPDGPATTTVSVTATDEDDESGSDSKQVTISNVAPTVELSGDETANEGQTKTYTFAVSDPGNDTFTVASGYPDCGTGGILVTGSLNTTATGGSFDCRFPDGPANPVIKIKVQDSDETASNEATRGVRVDNVAPTVELTGPATADEGETKIYAYTVTDPGDDPNPTITESCGDNGTKTDTQEANSFRCTFPDGPANSTVSVNANDGDDAGEDEKQVRISNVAPVADDDGPYDAREDTPLTVPAESGVLDGDTDPGNDRIYARNPSDPDRGTVALNPENGSFVYTPDPNYNGPDSFTYQACDEDGACTARTTVGIQVAPVNDAPRANPDTARTNEVSPVVIRVLANDTDPDGNGDIDPSTVSVVTGPANGKTSVDPQTGRITYTPTRGFVGTDSFTYKVCDGSGACSQPATVTITVSQAACTIRGTAGDDRLRGTAGDDVICTFGGDDAVSADLGRDIIKGGDGSDTLFGAGGDDVIRGGPGVDALAGQAGRDKHFGEGGNDRLDGRDAVSANDSVDGGTGTDTCRADPGDAVTGCP